MVEVFKTNVHTRTGAENLTKELQRHFPGCIVSFDPDDCDKVLRVEGEFVTANEVIELLASYDFIIEMLPD